MVKDRFSHVDQWVFDLDNTLYPPRARLFDQIEIRMTKYVMDALGVESEFELRLDLGFVGGAFAVAPGQIPGTPLATEAQFLELLQLYAADTPK